MIRVFETTDALARAGAEEFAIQSKKSINEKSIFTVVLSGGSTPQKLFSILAEDISYAKDIDWNNIHFFWGDERSVSPDNPDSNYKMAFDAMLSKLPIPESNIHRMKGELKDLDQAAIDYEMEIRNFFELKQNKFPTFDLAYLGVGNDGHTASLFPGTKALNEDSRIAVANWIGKLNTTRITLTASVFNHASNVVFLVSGDDKAPPLKSILEGNYEPLQLPSQLIRPANGKLLWLIDQKAAVLLNR